MQTIRRTLVSSMSTCVRVTVHVSQIHYKLNSIRSFCASGEYSQKQSWHFCLMLEFIWKSKEGKKTSRVSSKNSSAFTRIKLVTSTFWMFPSTTWFQREFCLLKPPHFNTARQTPIKSCHSPPPPLPRCVTGGVQIKTSLKLAHREGEIMTICLRREAYESVH